MSFKPISNLQPHEDASATLNINVSITDNRKKTTLNSETTSIWTNCQQDILTS